MELLNRNILNQLKSVEKDVCISIYITTHRNHLDNLQDPIKYKNLLKQLVSLKQHNSPGDAVVLLTPFEACLTNSFNG